MKQLNIKRIGLMSMAAAVWMAMEAVPAPDGMAVPRDTSFTVWSTARKVLPKHPELSVAVANLTPEIEAHEDMVYSTLTDGPYAPRALHADVYRPAGATEPLPALIMVHGGGWNSGDKSLQRPMAVALAHEGFVTIPVEYRLIPEALYPAGLHDIKTAVRWVRSHAAELGVDPDRIAISGCSAGGQLATLVGATNGSAVHEGNGEWLGTSSSVQAVVCIDGISTFISNESIDGSYATYEKKGVKSVDAQWLGGLYDESPENWREASAVAWVTPQSAPVCYIHSDLPRYTEGRKAMAALLTSLGIATEEHRIPIDVHPFWFFHPWMDNTVALTASWLRRTMK